MANVGYATLSVIPSLKGFQSSLGSQLGSSGVTGTARKSGERVGGVFGGSIARAIGTSIIGYAAFTAVTGAVKATTQAIFGFNSQQENARIAFTNFFGSAKKADKLMRDLLNFARTTPFEITGLTQNAQSLLAMGISAKDLLPTLTAVGDAVAAVGGDAGTLERVNTAIGQIAAKGRVQGDELRQLTENGIPAVRILANEYKLTQAKFLEFVTAGKINAKKALPLLLKGIEEGTKGVNGETAKMGGIMQSQSKTFTGALSNIKDGFNQTVGQGFKPFFDVVEKGMARLAELLGSKRATKLAQNFAKGLASGLSGIGKIISGVSSAANAPPPDAAAGLRKPGAGKGVLAPEQSGLGAKAGQLLQTTLAKLKPLITTIASAWKATATSFLSGLARIAVAGQALIGPLGAAFDVIVAKVGPKITELGATLSSGFTQISTIVSTQLIPAIVRILPILAPVAAFLLNVFLGAVVGAIKGIIKVIVGLVGIITGVVNVITGLVHGDWSLVWQGMKQIVAGAFKAIIGIIQFALNAGVLGVFRKGLALIKAIGTGGWRALLAAPRALMSGVKSLARAGLSGVAALFRTYLALIKGSWRNGWTLIQLIVGQAKGKVISAAKGLLSGVKGALSGAGTLLLGVGRAIVSGLISGIKGAAGAIPAAAASLVDKIPGTVKKLLNIHSPSKVMAKIGAEVPNGLVVGLKSKKAKIRSATRALVSDFARGFEGKIKGSVKEIQRAFNDLANDLDKLGKHHLAKFIDRLGKEQVKLAKQRDAVAKQIAKQKDLIADLKSQRAQLRDAVFDKLSGTSNFIDFGTSIDGIVAKLQSSKAITAEFASSFKALQKAGLNKTTLTQLANADPDQAVATMRTLLANKGQIKNINSLVADINTNSTIAGKAAGSMFDAGIKTAEGFLKGLQSQEKKILKYMDKLAKKLAKEFRKSLKIKSPSQVTRQIGSYTGQGLGLGLLDEEKFVQKAANRLLPTFPKKIAGPVGLPSASAGDGVSGLAVHVHIGDRELKEIVKVEVKKENVGTARSITNGRR